MSNTLTQFIAVLALVVGTVVPVRAELPRLFNAERHMRVEEVKPGMTGYGLTVFLGTDIERFEVEVVSVLRNFNPKRDVILIRCLDDRMKHTGAVAGMSGSPIFLRDDRGRERMIGAFAYGWPHAKDAIAGVQPIEYMLALADEPLKAGKPAGKSGARVSQPINVLASLSEATRAFHAPLSVATGDTTGRRMLTPVSVSGIPTVVLQRYETLFAGQHLRLLQAGGGVGAGELPDVPIEPGSVIITPLLTGDVEFHANGTCTEVIEGQVFAFGHPFNNEGTVELPMASGAVQGIVASLESSFKMAAMGKPKGTVHTDHTVGIAGVLGTSPATIPIDLKIIRDGRVTQFHFDAVRHPRLLPILVAISMDAALAADGELPQYSTLRYDVDISFDNKRSLRLSNIGANLAPGEFAGQLIAPLRAAADNPFERVLPSKVEATLTVTSEARDAQILAVQIPKSKFRAGDRIQGFITYRPFRGDEANLPFSFEIPRDLADGTYQLVVGDFDRYFSDEVAARPFRFSAETVGEIFDVMQDVYSARHDAVYIRLLRQPDGVAVGRVAMNQLPSSRRQVLLGAGRSNVTSFVSSNVLTMHTEKILTGAAEFTITVERKTKVEQGPVPTTRPG